MIRGDNAVPVEPDRGDVGDVTFEASDLPGPVYEALVDATSGAGEFHEPVLLEGPGPVDRLQRCP